MYKLSDLPENVINMIDKWWDELEKWKIPEKDHEKEKVLFIDCVLGRIGNDHGGDPCMRGIERAMGVEHYEPPSKFFIHRNDNPYYNYVEPEKDGDPK